VARGLEDQIIARPGDRALRQVHADWLADGGDPRGELASLQLAMEERAELPAELVARHRELVERHCLTWQTLGAASRWDGLFASGSELDVCTMAQLWRGGFIDALCFSGRGDRLRQLLGSASCRLTRHVDVDFFGDRVEHGYEDAVDALCEHAGNLRALRSLGIGVLVDVTGADGVVKYHGSTMENGVRLADALPQLTQLTVRVRGPYTLGDFTRLRALDVVAAGHRPSLAALLDRRLPRLEQLRLPGPDLLAVADALAGLAERLPALRRVTAVLPHGEGVGELLRATLIAVHPRVAVEIVQLPDPESSQEQPLLTEPERLRLALATAAAAAETGPTPRNKE